MLAIYLVWIATVFFRSVGVVVAEGGTLTYMLLTHNNDMNRVYILAHFPTSTRDTPNLCVEIWVIDKTMLSLRYTPLCTVN